MFKLCLNTWEDTQLWARLPPKPSKLPEQRSSWHSQCAPQKAQTLKTGKEVSLSSHPTHPHTIYHQPSHGQGPPVGPKLLEPPLAEPWDDRTLRKWASPLTSSLSSQDTNYSHIVVVCDGLSSSSGNPGPRSSRGVHRLCGISVGGAT